MTTTDSAGQPMYRIAGNARRQAPMPADPVSRSGLRPTLSMMPTAIVVTRRLNAPSRMRLFARSNAPSRVQKKHRGYSKAARDPCKLIKNGNAAARRIGRAYCRENSVEYCEALNSSSDAARRAQSASGSADPKAFRVVPTSAGRP